MKYYGILRPIDKQILNVARNVRRHILENFGTTKFFCEEASNKIYQNLTKINIKCRLWSGLVSVVPVSNGIKRFESHCVVKVRGCYLDVTADQFNSMIVDDYRFRSIVYGRPEDLPVFQHFYRDTVLYKKEDRHWFAP